MKRAHIPTQGGEANAPHDESADPRIISRVQRGEIGALGVLFDRYDRDVRRVAARLGVRLADIDDIVQATFLDVLHASKSYDGRANAKPWILGLAVIRVRRHRRSLGQLAARAAAWAREPLPKVATPEESASMSELAKRAANALESLSPKKREVVALVAIEGLSGEEAASILGIPVATVWTRLHHARLEMNQAVFEEES